MTPARLSMFSMALLGAFSTGSIADQTSPQLGIRDKTPNLIALINATVVTEPGQALSGAMVLIRDGKIEAVSRDVKVPKGYQSIDLAGYHLYQ